MPGFARVEVRYIRQVGQSRYIAIPAKMMRELKWRVNDPIKITINNDELMMQAVEKPAHEREVVQQV